MDFTLKVVTYKTRENNDAFVVQVKHDGERHAFDSSTLIRALNLASQFMAEKWRQENN